MARAGIATALSDGLFSSVLVVVFYHSGFSRLWQGVAATLLGPSAFSGGPRTALIGLAMHVGVALGWSTVFLVLVTRWPGLRALVTSRYGVVKAAALYGPFVWLMMSLVVVPLLLQRPPRITYRWWVQFVGHVPFVGVPIVATVRADLPARERT